MPDSLINQVATEDMQSMLNSEVSESLINAAEQENSLLSAADLEQRVNESGTHLSVYDQPDITPASVHEEYPNGIPPCEIQAQIVFENYVRNSNRLLSGKEKRRLYRECLKNAKKGRYTYMFDKEKIAKREERMRKNFEKLNNPQ